MSRYHALFSPLTIKHLRIRNRLLSTSHAPGYAVGGRITERYLRYQEEKARGGVGLTQFGGATAVSIENSFHYGQNRPVSAHGECDQGGSEGAGVSRHPGDGRFHRRVRGHGGARRHDRHDARLHRGPAFRRQGRPRRRGRRTAVRGRRLLRGPRDQREGRSVHPESRHQPRGKAAARHRPFAGAAAASTPRCSIRCVCARTSSEASNERP